MFTIILLTIIFVFIKGLHILYLFQIKEYRLDRLLSHIREKTIQKVFYTSKNKYPSKSLRNIAIIGFLGLTDLILFLFALENNYAYYFMTFALPFSPFIAFGIIAIASYGTELPVQVYRTLLVLQAYIKVKYSKTVFIGITGSYGKTTVKEYLAHVLGGKFNVAKTEKNMNTNAGIALSILRHLTKKTEFFITEVGAYRKGEIKKASWYMPFSYGILTGLGNQHVDLYGSRKILIDEESSLLYDIPETGKTYINSNIPEKEYVLSSIKAHKVLYGLKHSQVRVHILHQRPTMTTARVSYNGYDFTIVLHLPGEHSLLNILPVIALSIDLGMKPVEITARLDTLRPVTGKLSIHEGRSKSTIINDSVNSNVDGFIAGIKTLHSFSQTTKYIVTQGIIELGVEKRSSYEQILQELYKTNSKLLTTDVLFHELDSENRVMIFNDVSGMQQKLLTLMNRHTIILIEGKFTEAFTKQLFI